MCGVSTGQDPAPRPVTSVRVLGTSSAFPAHQCRPGRPITGFAGPHDDFHHRRLIHALARGDPNDGRYVSRGVRASTCRALDFTFRSACSHLIRSGTAVHLAALEGDSAAPWHHAPPHNIFPSASERFGGKIPPPHEVITPRPTSRTKLVRRTPVGNARNPHRAERRSGRFLG